MSINDIRRINLISYIAQHHEGNRAAFCRATGKNPNLINLVLTDNPGYRRNIGEKLARDIEKRCELEPGWLDVAGGMSAKHVLFVPFVEYSNAPTKPPDRADYAWILPTDEPHFATATAPARIVAVKMEGSTMKPSIQAGDPVFLDLGVKELDSDGVYLVRRGEKTELRRIQDVGGGDIRIGVDNSTYQPIAGPRKQLLKEFVIVGKALFAMTKVDL
jgi:hypothetical protein